MWSNVNSNESYEGEFISNQRYGHGTLTYPNGDIYDGEFRSHKLCGSGAYLKEGSYVIEGNFRDNRVEGFARISWNRRAVYEGLWKDGVISSGVGTYAAVEGSYLYGGGFVDGKPVSVAKSLFCRLDRSTVPPPPVLEAAPKPDDKKVVKKDASKDKKSTSKDIGGSGVGGNNTVVVTAGTLIGSIHVMLSQDDAPTLEKKRADTSLSLISDAPLSLPDAGLNSLGEPLLLNEIRRSVSISLVAYVPPALEEMNTAASAAPAKGKPVAGKASAAQPSLSSSATAQQVPRVVLAPLPPVPIWVKQNSMRTEAMSWNRFPANSVKYLGGKCVKRGENNLQYIQVSSRCYLFNPLV